MSERLSAHGKEKHPRAKRVRVVGDPEGGPPEWVRNAWLGVEFEAVPCLNTRVSYRESSSHKPTPTQPCWELPAQDAVAALREYGQYEAADWWESRGFCSDEQKKILAFRLDSCEPVDGSTVLFPVT